MNKSNQALISTICGIYDNVNEQLFDVSAKVMCLNVVMRPIHSSLISVSFHINKAILNIKAQK